MKWYYNDGVATKGYATIFGYRRRNVLIILAAVVFLLVFIIALAVGLTLRNGHSQSLPLTRRSLIVVKTCLFQVIQEVFIRVT